MSRLTDRFSKLRTANEAALICYVVGGDPSFERTIEIILELDAAGVDIIELGVPFSDPMADGPVIQAGSQRALEAGATVQKTLAMVTKIRQSTQIPIVIMTYYNPVMRYGVERFAKDAAYAGVDGVIQTDLTPEESDEWVSCARQVGLDTVFLVAPTSTVERIKVVAKLATGFVYVVSRTGVTGAQSEIPDELPQLVDRVREQTELPICIGFGVSTPEHASKICGFADGVVVGSALVDVIAKGGDTDRTARLAGEFAAHIKSATQK